MTKDILNSHQEQLSHMSPLMIECLGQYHDLLKKWNKKINLISRQEKELIQRHILDSLQLEKLIPDKEAVIYDLGSGAGLPGVILAIAGFSNVFLIEINKKKSVFLNMVKATLKLKVNVVNNDIRKIHLIPTLPKPNIIVARAFASLETILQYAKELITEDTTLLIYKSKLQQQEIEIALDKYSFELKKINNCYNDRGVIIAINRIKCHR